MTLFLCGDVMTGRGIDQILPHPGSARLFESYARAATAYVSLAEEAGAVIPRGVAFDYIWGIALEELERMSPRARIVNLETAVTTSEAAWPGKGIHYRMHPANVGCLAAARIDCCVLANNHVLDWGRPGLMETIATLLSAGIRTCGAGSNATEAAAPAIIDTGNEVRVRVHGFCTADSGVPEEWQATRTRAGLNWVPDLSDDSVDRMVHSIGAGAAGDIVVASIHWGGNWGFEISSAEREAAHALIERAGADIVHGHSSHHPKGMEVYRGRLILYGCGDLLNDYEGIGGYEEYGAGLGMMYFPRVDAGSGRLLELSMTPTRMRRFSIARASPKETAWLRKTLDRECRPLGAAVIAPPDGGLALRWHPGEPLAGS